MSRDGPDYVGQPNEFSARGKPEEIKPRLRNVL
jgi:hypothetical protein